jgi:hypothetical protein
LQSKIDALSDSEKSNLNDVANSVVTDMLSQVQEQNPINELELENKISSQYNVTSSVADIIVEVLLTYPQYSKLITPQTDGNNTNNTMNQQPTNTKTKTASTTKTEDWGSLRKRIVNGT